MYEYFPQVNLDFLKAQTQKESNVLFFSDRNYTRELVKWYAFLFVGPFPLRYRPLLSSQPKSLWINMFLYCQNPPSKCL
jgi:hypothetical protein